MLFFVSSLQANCGFPTIKLENLMQPGNAQDARSSHSEVFDIHTQKQFIIGRWLDSSSLIMEIMKITLWSPFIRAAHSPTSIVPSQIRKFLFLSIRLVSRAHETVISLGA
jgi:hypothetical protein